MAAKLRPRHGAPRNRTGHTSCRRWLVVLGCCACGGLVWVLPLRQPRALRTPVAADAPASKLSLTLTASSHRVSLAAAIVAATVSGYAAHGRQKVAAHAARLKKVGTREVPWNAFSVKSPYTATVLENRRLAERTTDPNWETCHIVLKHDGGLPFVEGQSVGIIAPGPDKKGETPAKPRLYSIASSAMGDDGTSTTMSLCVKRNVVLDAPHSNRNVGEDQPDRAGTWFPDHHVYRGVCSNYVCDLKPGDEVLLTGPTGAELLLPESRDVNLLMLGTGTGVAPFRGFLQRLFSDGSFQGLAWLFLGVPHSASLLYSEEHARYQELFPARFRCDYAISREQQDRHGQRMHIQNRMAEYSDELWELVQKPNTQVFLCGLKAMKTGVNAFFEAVASKHGMVWQQLAKELKKQKRLHIEVY